MKIVIKEENRAKIAEVLQGVQGKCRERIIEVDDVFELCKNIERKFQIAKNAMDGCEFICRPFAQKVPNAYRYPFMGTVVTLTVKNGKFQLIDCSRDYSGNKREFSCRLTEAAKQAILNRYTNFDFIA